VTSTRLRRETLPAGIAGRLRRQIAEGELQPGHQLPGHRELATMYSVSLSTVREAISMLVSAGLVETRAGRGTYVASGDASAPRPARVGPPLSRREVEELVEARMVIEVQLARLAAERASTEQILALRGAVDQMQVTSTSTSDYPDADVEFHVALAKAANNRYLLQAMTDIRAFLRDDMQLGAEAVIRRFGSLSISVESHRLLADAVAARDREAAGRIAGEIVNRNREFVLGLYALGPQREGAA
jgi:GntR family transcriptional regulator, transcriptional repressor for pyruvate dehydrogenase complex